MAKIMRMTDRRKLTIGDVTFWLAPLNKEQKREVSLCTYFRAGKQRLDMVKAQNLMVKYSVKGVDGVEDMHGEKYELSFDNEGNLTDDCVSELLYIEGRQKFNNALWQLLNGHPDEIVDPETGEKMQGVALELVKTSSGSS